MLSYWKKRREREYKRRFHEDTDSLTKEQLRNMKIEEFFNEMLRKQKNDILPYPKG